MSWKKQGGTNRLDATSNVNVNSVVANKFTIKDYFYGDMNVLGNINAEGSMKVKANLLASYVGAENIFANLTLKVLRNATIYGSMAVKKDMYVYERQILGNIERNNNIVTVFNNNSITGNLGITQAKILDSRTGVAELYFDGHIGFGTNNPVATLDIAGNIPLTFAVRTDNTNNYSILSRNNEDTGVVAHTDLATSEIQFYKETPIPEDISGAIPDAVIQYIEGGVLAIEAEEAVITYSKSVLTTRDEDQPINNSALTIYDIENGQFAYDAYNSESIKSNAISISGPDAASMSMIHFTNADTNSGISIGGGAYPPNISQRMGTIGYTQPDGTYAPTINIVSSATNRLFHRATVGINTQYPRTDEYIMDVNGPMVVRTTTETNVVQNIPYEIDVLKHCRSDHNYIIVVGKPYTVAGDPDTFYTDDFKSTVVKNYQQKVYFTRNMGQTWSVSDFNDTDIGLLPNNAIHAAYAHDANLCFVCTQRGFMYYSVNGGFTWYGIAGLPVSDNIHSIFITDRFVGTNSVYRVFVCGKTTCTWFDMPTTFYLSPTNFTIFSLNHSSFSFPGICETADGIDQIMYITAANRIYSYNIGNYAEPLGSAISGLNTTGDSYVAMSLGSQYVAMFVGPGIITYTTDGGDTYTYLSASNNPILEDKTLNSVFLEDDTTVLISGYDATGAFFIYSKDQFATLNTITVEDLRRFGAPPHVLTSQQLYDAFLVSPESIMFFDIVQPYNADLLIRGESTIYNMYLPHLFTPAGSTRSTSNGAAFRVDYGVAQFGDNVIIEKDVAVNGELTASSATLMDTSITGAHLYGQTYINGPLDINAQLNLYADIFANGELITPQQLTYISGVTQNIQPQLDDKLGKSETATVSGQLTFSGNNTFLGNNVFSGSNTFDNLRVASTGLTTVISPELSYTITPTKLSYLRNVSSDLQTQLNDKLSLTAGGAVLNGTYTFNGQINIANTVVVADNTTVSPADFAAMKGSKSNFQAQLDLFNILIRDLSGNAGNAGAILDSAMVANVTLNTFSVPNRFNNDTIIVGNVIANNATITPTQLSYLSSVTSNIQTQLNNRVSLNSSSGIDISGTITSASGVTTAMDVIGNTIKTQYQVLSGTSVINTSTYSLTAAQSGSIVNLTSATTLTLPAPTTLGLWFMVYNSSPANCSVVTPAGLFVPYPDASGITLLPDSTLQVRSNGANWAVVGGTYDCARLSYPNFSLGDYSTAGSISASTNLTIAGKAAIGKTAVSATDALDVSGSMHVKGNSFVEGRNLTWGNLDVSGAVTVSDSVMIGNSVGIGKTASPGIEFDLSGDAAISGSLSIGRTRNPAYIADISGAIHGTSIAIDNAVTIGGASTIAGAVSVGSTMTVAGATRFSSNVGIGKPANAIALDVSGAISATTLAASTLSLSGNPSSGFALDMSGNIRAKMITLTDGVGLPAGGVSDSALSTNVALLNRNTQTFTGDNHFKYISVGGATKPTGTKSYAIDISGGLRVMSGSVVLPDGAISALNLPSNVCFKDGNNLYLVSTTGTIEPYLGVGKGAMATQYNIDVSGSMNADGPIYAQKLGINNKGTTTPGVDVDISGTASISNTLTVGKKITIGSPSVVIASATINKRSGAYDLYWAAANSANLSTQLSPIFTAINLSTRQITYTPYTTNGTYTITYVFDYAAAITHPAVMVYPNYVSELSTGTGYPITFPVSAVQKGAYSVNATLVNGMNTGTMYVDIGNGAVLTNLVANTQSIIVSLARTATTDANTTTPSSATDAVPFSVNGAAVFNAPARFAGGVYADTYQTIHFGANAPIMSGSNILPGTIPSTAFATSGVDLGTDQTVNGAKTFANNLTVSSPYRLLVGTPAVNAERNNVIAADISGGIQASQYMTVGTTTIFNMVSKRTDGIAFNITNTDVFGYSSSGQSVRTYSINPLNAALIDASNVVLPKAFAVSGYYTFTMSYTPSVSTNRFASNVVLSAVVGDVVSATPLATLNLTNATTASATIYLASGIQNIRISAPSTVSGLAVTQVSLKVDYRYDNTTALDYKLAVNGDQAIFGKFVPYFGIDASASQPINFGANAPTMSGANIAAATIPSAALAGSVALLGASQTFTGTNAFTSSATTNTNLIQVNRNVGGTGYVYLNNSGNIGFFNGSNLNWNIAVDGTPTFKANSITDGTLSTNVALLTGAQSFSGAKTFTGGLTVSGVTTTFTTATAHNGGITATTMSSSGLSTLNSLSVTGTSTFAGTVTTNGITNSGTITTTTPDTNNNSTTVATTAFVKGQNYTSLTTVQTTANTFSQLNTFSAGIYMNSDIRINEKVIYFKGGSDTYNYLKYGTTAPFGPELSGYDGGKLQYTNPSATTAMAWSSSGITCYKGIVASASQTINFGANAPTMSGASISTGTISLSSISSSDNIALINSTQTFSALKTFSAGLTVSNGTSSFAGTTNHTSGITTTTLTSSALSTLSSLAVTNASTFTGTSTFTGATTHNGGLTASTATTTGVLTTTGGITATTTQTINFGGNSPIMNGLQITNIPDSAINNSENYLRKNAVNSMGFNGDYFQFNNVNASGYIYINGQGSIGYYTGSRFSWSISSGGIFNLQTISITGSLSAGNTGTTLTGTTAINGQLLINTVPAYSTNTPAEIVFDSSLKNVMFGINNMSLNNPVITGTYNIGIGISALNANKIGGQNIAIGYQAIQRDSSGNSCIGIGYGALFSQSNGADNVAIGLLAGRNITTGRQNTAIGGFALAGSGGTDAENVITGGDNSAVGFRAGYLNRAGVNNTYLGAYSDQTTGGPFNTSTAIGYNAKITASNQIVLGTSSETVVIPGNTLKLGTNLSIFSYGDADGKWTINTAGVGMTWGNQYGITSTYHGNGANITDLNASNIAGGTLADGRLSSNIPRLNADNYFTGNIHVASNKGFYLKTEDYHHYLRYSGTADGPDLAGYLGGRLGYTQPSGTFVSSLEWSSASVTTSKDLRISPSKRLYFGDLNLHYLGYTNDGMDGPDLAGYAGGRLGYTSPGSFNSCLSWSSTGITATSITATSYNSTSDQRRKKNIRDLGSQLDKIKALAAREFEWKETGVSDIGFVAQEVFDVYPELNPVQNDPAYEDKLYPVNADGTEHILTVQYGKMTTYLWKGMSELIDTVETQKSQIDHQKSQIDHQKSQIDAMQAQMECMQAQIQAILLSKK